MKFFNPFKSKKQVQTKEEAIAQVERNNKEDYLKIYSFATAWLMFRSKPFTSEDLKEAYYTAKNPALREPRIIGAVFNALSKDGFIQSKDQFQLSRNPVCHRRPQRIWISAINQELSRSAS